MNLPSRRYVPPSFDGPPPAGSVVHLPHLWRAVWRARLWIVAMPVLLVVIVGIWTTFQDPEYEATATLLLESEAPAGGGLAQQVAAFTGLGGGGAGSMETDIRLLASRQIAEQVVDSLAMQVVVLEPAVPRDELFSQVRAAREAFVGRLVLTLRPDGRYALSATRSDPAAAPVTGLPESVAGGEAFEVEGIHLQLAPSGGGEPPETIEVQVMAFRTAAQRFLRDLEVERAGGALAEVRVRHQDPILSAGAANAVVGRFIDYRRQTNRSDARGAIDFLRDQVQHYETQLREAEERLREFRERAVVVNPDASATSQAQRLSTLDAQRAELVAERDVLAELVREVGTTATGGEGSAAYRKLAAFPEFFRNPAVQNILSSLVQLENQRSELLVRRTTESVDVQGITARIGELEEQLYLTATNYLASLEEQIAAADRTIARSTGQASRIPDVQTQFLRLTREVELLDEIYTLLQMRLKEQEVTEADARSSIRPVDEALVPLAPVSPKPKLNLILALAAGLMLGLGVALARAVLDPAMYSREVALEASGGMPILISLPEARPGGVRLLPGAPAALLRRGTGNPPASASTQRLAAASPAHVAEAYADLRTRLAMFTEPPPRVLLVTSPSEGDGKSTVAANLALAYARHGTRTLLLEGDLRRGRLAGQLRLPAGAAGLGEVLSGTATAAEAILQHRDGGERGVALDVLLAGSATRHPTELLDSPALTRLMEELRERYEVIVVDTPPLGAVADSLLLARVADGALLVTRAGATDRTALEEAVAELTAVGTHVHGLVLKGFDDRRGARYAYGRT